mgnify:CR=1 FL=1
MCLHSYTYMLDSIVWASACLAQSEKTHALTIKVAPANRRGFARNEFHLAAAIVHASFRTMAGFHKQTTGRELDSQKKAAFRRLALDRIQWLIICWGLLGSYKTRPTQEKNRSFFQKHYRHSDLHDEVTNLDHTFGRSYSRRCPRIVH